MYRAIFPDAGLRSVHALIATNGLSAAETGLGQGSLWQQLTITVTKATPTLSLWQASVSALGGQGDAAWAALRDTV